MIVCHYLCNKNSTYHYFLFPFQDKFLRLPSDIAVSRYERNTKRYHHHKIDEMLLNTLQQHNHLLYDSYDHNTSPYKVTMADQCFITYSVAMISELI